MDGLLKGIPGVILYIDDKLVTGKTDQKHERLELTELDGCIL